jgi:hypothetical protein
MMHTMPGGKRCATVISDVRDQRAAMLIQRRDARFDHFEAEGGRVWAYRLDAGEWTRIYCGWDVQAAQNIIELS